MNQRRIITPLDIEEIADNKGMWRGGGGTEMVNYIHNNGIRYQFRIKSGIRRGGIKYYAVLENKDKKGDGMRCLYGEIDSYDNSVFIVMNISKSGGCGVPFEDKGLTKKMIGLITRILKKREPDVRELEVTDMAGVNCSDAGRRSYYLSDLFLLKGEPSFYEKLGFVHSENQGAGINRGNTNGIYTNVNKDNLIVTKNNIGGRIIKVEYLGKLIEATYDTGDSKFDDYIDMGTIEFDREEMPLAEMVTFLVEKHCIIYQKFAKTLMWKYGIRSVVGEQFYKDI